MRTILTFFFFTEVYSCPELRNRLRPAFCQLAGFLVRFLVGVLPVLGPHSQPIGSTEEPVERLVVEEPELELGDSSTVPEVDGPLPALDGEGFVAAMVLVRYTSSLEPTWRLCHVITMRAFDWSHGVRPLRYSRK